MLSRTFNDAEYNISIEFRRDAQYMFFNISRNQYR